MDLPGSEPAGRANRRCAASLACKHGAVGIGREDGHRAAVHQHLQLFFGRAASLALRFDLIQMPESGLAAADHFVDEEPHAEERGEDQNIARDAGAGAPVEGVENLGQQGAKSGDDRDLPALQNAADHQHGKQVQEAEGDVLVGAPVGEGDDGDEQPRFEQNGLGAATKEERKHGDARRFSHILDTQSSLFAILIEG